MLHFINLLIQLVFMSNSLISFNNTGSIGLIAALMLLSCDKTSASDSNTHGFTASEKAVLCWCARKTEPSHGNTA